MLDKESILKLSSKIKLVINKTNKGRGFCRDLGVSMTTGKFILMVDATNYIEPDFIKKSMIQFLTLFLYNLIFSFLGKLFIKF